ncbi:hypothetical protein Tamer19_13230 [Cupriavidus sp. TA19]|uniref:hypothetical protein n=1 Tax=unclassified Cupriavidus TaxID=2640874 RepID=UPI000EF07D24|nr:MULTISPECIES: hypothetical protein [unclassified Cupriavidus]BDB28014.1 hypothetical protein CTP10_R54250 [Cupriavidus sp. P-10]GLC91915.1 hypothetical protein Tamer19_13230 [Cupriavidus sp. TA19]
MNRADIIAALYLHAVMMAALGHGLETCAQQAFARYHQVISAQLAIPDRFAGW